MSKNEFREQILKIEKAIDSDYKEIKLWQLNREFALLLICTYYEKCNYEVMLGLDKQSISFIEKNHADITIRILHETLDWLIRNIYRYCPEKSGLTSNNFKSYQHIEEVIIEAFSKGILHSNMERIFSPFWADIYKVVSVSKSEIEFEYQSDMVAKYEGINSVLISELQRSKANEFKKLMNGLLHSPKIENIDHYFSILTHKMIEDSFDLPDEYKIGPYKISDIKKLWHQVLFEVWHKEYENLLLLDKNSEADIEITDLTPVFNEANNIQNLDLGMVKSFLDDLTFTGKPKLNQSYSSPLRSPIIEISNKRKVVSPRFILNNSSQRNIIAALGHMYGDEANKESEIKEEYFIKDLNQMMIKFHHLNSNGSIAITDTNVDYALYDTNSNTLCLFELKWFLEPISAREIKNKDQDIGKGLNEQLPKYKNYIEENLGEFTRRAFNEELEVNNIFYFVLTRNTIGSGLIPINDRFKAINIRMFEKAMLDSNGCLKTASQNLIKGLYYPQEGKDFEIRKIKYEIGDIIIHTEVVIHLTNEFILDFVTL